MNRLEPQAPPCRAERPEPVRYLRKAQKFRRPEAHCLWIAALMLLITSIGAAAQPDTVTAVWSSGRGVLTKRIDWLVASSRRTYHHIRLPSRIAVGDTITLSFGSSTKTYGFLVARITLKGNHCLIFSKAEIHHHRDKISVTPCYSAD
jgi:hypothetical protein